MNFQISNSCLAGHRLRGRSDSRSRQVKFQISVTFIWLAIALNTSFIKQAVAQESIGVPASYNITYGISDTGQTRVQIDGQLYNPSQDVYISKYSLTLSTPDAENITTSDSKGKITPTIEKNGSQTKISITFNDKVVGTDRPLKFKLNYSSKSIATKSGLVWEIVIPKAADFRNIKSYNVAINIPNDLGPQIYASPQPVSIEKTLTQKIYKYDAERLSKTGAILSFGPHQIYNFDLKYHLKNSNFFNGLVKIAIPPSILSEQQIVYDQIYPAPQEVAVDPDGNYIATYNLPAGKTTLVSVKGKAKILNQARDISISGTFSEIPPSLQIYTTAQKYWETGSPEITRIVNQVAGEITPQSSVSQVAQKLFDYTAKSLTYDSSRIKPDLTRFGALKALENRGQAVCMEFADLLITLLRAAGIPAQLFEGYAYTKDEINRPAIGDVLHSWVRVYLPRLGWVAVDPTWSNTTGGLDYFGHLDTNHFVFAIKGTNSETPYPAGAYKISPDQVGDINVEVEEKLIDLESQNVISGNTYYNSSFFERSKSLTLEITNAGKQTIFSAKLAPNPNIFPSFDKIIQLGDIPPYGKVTKTLTLSKEPAINSPLSTVSFMNFEERVENRSLPYLVDSAKKKSGGIAFPVTVSIVAVLLLYGSVALLLNKKPGLWQ